MSQIFSVLSADDYLFLLGHQGSRSATKMRGGARAWWNFPAKVEAAIRIKDEENDRHRGRNGHQDGMRHAEWSRRTAQEAGPIFSTLAGVAHEIDNLVSRDGPISETIMDLSNNAEGIAAAKAGRPVNPSRIQNEPLSLGAVAGRREDKYEDETPNRTSYPSRPYGDNGTSRRGYKDGASRRRPEERYPAY